MDHPLRGKVQGQIAQERKDMKTTHTPGPWTVSGSHIVSSRTAVQLAQVYSPQGYDPKCEREQANARLIAAAPELLAACHAAFERLNGTDVSQQLAAAIAKAQGK
jgi:hypothetical protein